MSTGRIGKRKQEIVATTLPEVGKIKVGEKGMSQSGKEYPKSLDYFKATGNFANAFTQIYGDKPQSIDIAFISDNLAEVCNERYESWIKGKRWGYGDGETFTIWDEGLRAYVPDVPKTDPRIGKLPWEVVLTLRFVLLKMRGVMGYWSFTTKGKLTTIPSVIKAFDFVRERAQTIVGFPFRLMVEKKSGYSPGDPKSFPVVTLVPTFTEDAIELVKSFIESGGKIQEITTKMIEQKQVLQLENKSTGEIPQDSK